MQISDNGIGKGDVIQGTRFGGQLISLLTRQLGDIMKEENESRTRICIEFKSDKAT